jgi:hypothetical protein
VSDMRDRGTHSGWGPGCPGTAAGRPGRRAAWRPTGSPTTPSPSRPPPPTPRTAGRTSGECEPGLGDSSHFNLDFSVKRSQNYIIDLYRFVSRTAGNISVHYFRFEHFLLDYFVYFFKAKFQSSQLLSVFERDMLINYIMFSNTKNNPLNNRDFNIDQNNRDYDFFHNQATLILTHILLPCVYPLTMGTRVHMRGV